MLYLHSISWSPLSVPSDPWCFLTLVCLLATVSRSSGLSVSDACLYSDQRSAHPSVYCLHQHVRMTLYPFFVFSVYFSGSLWPITSLLQPNCPIQVNPPLQVKPPLQVNPPLQVKSPMRVHFPMQLNSPMHMVIPRFIPTGLG